MAIRCFVLDDEPLATNLLQDYISRLPDLELVGISNSPSQALGTLQQMMVDVIFLDIQMPRLTGFDLLRPLSYRPKVIFTTAFREYALESYEFDVVDFLVKPISFERFLQSIGKLYRFSAVPFTPSEVQEQPNTTRDYQYFKVDKEMVKLYLDDILWIESLKDYVRIHTVSGSVVSYLRISYLEEKLPPNRFIRIHKSFIVALNHVQAVSATYIRVNNVEIPIGRIYKAKLDETLQKK
ncbi:LytTR family DNA-binding domain-containing protein [Cytophagaceae bacterium DM2B3-1]|uniref:LytTR family DNA-binding domain-containing protein n=1 Tax=Xanthocytophaga flava TaxID=3048013 RepID=A0ABT7CKA1_9BACT|nr:LytTR family DNA-binding domain-containing protein [Xanthocytophaga flavus]MDJ1470689.1 LytTR family DNA-binding domain-containing protein [Xanthocytophaga flavus]MDJ1493104.1 LytTR family DNA-binding domain-containing protein [Xanthocytophaga flavus]